VSAQDVVLFSLFIISERIAAFLRESLTDFRLNKIA